jgi:hypothetical protein
MQDGMPGMVKALLEKGVDGFTPLNYDFYKGG